MNVAARAIDFIARLAEAWDGGRNALTDTEKRALLALAWLPAELHNARWNEGLTADQRTRLVVASRVAIQFGRQCSRMFGEGA